jgi:hypothetical protein
MKIRGDIRSSRCTTGDRWQMEKIFNQKIFNYFVWTALGCRVNIFFVKFILSCQQFDNCVYCLPPASLTPVSTTQGKMVEDFAASVVDTGGNFAAGVVDTGGKFAAGVVDTGGAF